MDSDPITRNDERPCPVCGARAGDILHHRRFVLPDGHPLADGYSVLTCRDCGAAYASPLPPQEAYDRFYRDDSKYADLATGTGSGVQSWDDQRLNETACRIGEMTADRTTHIVDIGCGAGGLLRRLAALGFSNLTGIDPAPACAAVTSAIAGVRGEIGSFSSLPQLSKPAEFVVLSHVLEHVRDVGGAIEAIRAIVPANGRLYAEVPNAARYADFLVAPFLDFNTEHINHFSESTLRHLFGSHGWRVLDSGTKTIASSPVAQYPCAWILAEATGRMPVVRPEPDRTLRVELERYIAASEALLASVTERCVALDIPGRDVIVWGTGQTTAILLADTPLATAQIRAFTDSNPIHFGRTIAGVGVVSPDALRSMPDLPIVIGSLLHGAEIAAAISAHGLTNPVLRLDPNAP